ncbi:Glyoxalase-like domain-containing protein [Rhizobiales bacterium GAS113]|nr:Glyoxalase-like domain-containing protein [Rhizobiales bacterium GAS113]
MPLRAVEFGIVVQGINTFHHLGIVTRDLAGAVTKYESLGFVFTPLSLPEFPLSPGGAPEPVGVANRNAIFRNGYLEMLGIVDAARWASISTSQRGPFDIDNPLQRYEGLHVMHFGTEHLDQVRTRLVEDGLSPSPIRPFQRMVETLGGSELMRARCLSFALETNPEALFQIVQHETPELALQPRFMGHPNGAFALSEAILCVEDPEEVAGRYGRYAGHPVDRRGPLCVIDLGETRLVVVSCKNLTTLLPGEAAPTAPYLAGFTVTADVDQAAAFLRRQHIPFQGHDGRIIVSGRDASGSAVVFERPHAGR